jgi:hypothetical protein
MTAHSHTRTVSLGAVGDRSICVALFAMVDRAAAMRPDLAAALDGMVRLRFDEGYAPVLIDAGDLEEIVVGDDPGAAADAEIAASLPHLSALILTPQAGGIPAPWTREGRAALGRLAGGHVRITGSRNLARRLLALLSESP